MFAGKVAAPVYGEFEFVPFGDGFFENFDTVGIGQAYEFGIDHFLQTFDKSFVEHVVEELQIVLTVVECPFDTELDKFFFEIHQVGQICKSNFGFYHPKFG